MASTRRTDPFFAVLAWVRPNTGEACMFCKKPATYHVYPFIHYPFPSPDTPKGGIAIIERDRTWRESIEKQMRGEYTPATRQPMCQSCMLWNMSVLLRGDPHDQEGMKTLLGLALEVKRRYGLTASHVVGCTLYSPDDEGDTWGMNAPDTTIEEVVAHVRKAHLDNKQA